MDALIQDRTEVRARSVGSSKGTRLKILFAVASWGLGHATRDLPLIERMLDCGHDVTIVSTDRALALLKHELGERCSFLEWPDLPLSMSKSAPLYYAKYTLSLPLAFRVIVAEHRALDDLLRTRRFDRIVSDSRFGIRSDRVSSFQISHGLRFIAPRRSRLVEAGMEYFYYRCYGRRTRFVVPDFATDSLSGALSHDLRFVQPQRVTYIGILSRLTQVRVERDVDCYVSISGPEPQRTILQDLVLKQVNGVPGRVVVSLGKPEDAGRTWYQGSVEVHNYVNRSQQQDLMNRANLVVSRSGYTTMMELAELGKTALLIPTPGQTEQEYLADLHHRAGNFYAVQQSKLDLPRNIEIARGFPGYRPAHRTARSIERFMEIVAS